MKKRYLLTFILLLLPIFVNAKSNGFVWLDNAWTTDMTSTALSNNYNFSMWQTTIPTNKTSKISLDNVLPKSVDTSTWDYLIFNVYFANVYPDREYTNVDSNVVTGSYSNNTLFSVRLFETNVSSICEINTSERGGFYTIKCPLVKNTLSKISLIFMFRSPFGLHANELIYGVSRDVTVRFVDNTEKYQQQTNTKLDQTNKNLEETNKNITNSDTTGASGDANSFFSGFTTETHGLTSIITAPLQFIGSITSSSCSSIGLPMPFVKQTVQLPCMSVIYKKYFGSFLTIYQTITFGLVAYWVCVNIYSMVKGFKDPDSDKVEVMDL